MTNTKIKEINKVHLKELIQQENNKINSRNILNNNNCVNTTFSLERFGMFIKRNEIMLKKRKIRG